MTIAHAQQILVVDDDAVIRQMVYEVLIDVGYDFCETSESVGAWADIQLQSPALLITDSHMPVISGEDLIAEARAHVTTLPIIVISGTPSATWTSESDPAMIWLSKPFTIDNLLAAVAQLIGPPASSGAPTVV